LLKADIPQINEVALGAAVHFVVAVSDVEKLTIGVATVIVFTSIQQIACVRPQILVWSKHPSGFGLGDALTLS
jgi:hypothetical protein